MRSMFLPACGSAALAIVVACATSDPEEARTPLNDAGSGTASESEAPPQVDATVEDGGVRQLSPCNDAGWCATELPDPDLLLRDIWPFEGRAFAISESDSLGTKVLEWTAARSWAYIDDNSQNAYGSGRYAGKLWAPSENEVYYAVAPALIYHGTRANPSAPFTWEHSRLEYAGPDFGPERDPGRAWHRPNVYVYERSYAAAIGVWGTSADDVYAWYANRIYHRKSVDGGPPEWVLEHEEPADSQESFYIFGAAGSGSDDVWFVGSHGVYDGASGFVACSTLIRRTPDGYTRVVDHTLRNGQCTAKAGSLSNIIQVELPGVGLFTRPFTNTGWATSVASPRPGTAFALLGNEFFTYVDTADAGMARSNSVPVKLMTASTTPKLHSVWIHGDHAWLSGWSLVIDGENKPDEWARCLGLKPVGELAAQGIDGGAAYTISSIALNGAPLDRPVYQVRGSSNEDLWAVGPRYALHKTR